MAELQSIFPDGVCDWSKRGLNHVGVVVGTSHGPAPPLRGRRTVASRRVSELCMRPLWYSEHNVIRLFSESSPRSLLRWR